MTCSNCGTTVPDGYKFCTMCGHSMSKTEPIPATPPPEPPAPPAPPPPNYPPPQDPYGQGGSYGGPPPNQPGYGQGNYPPPGQPGPQSYQQPGAGGIHIDADGRGSGQGYRYEILHQPSFSLAVIQLQPEQSILAEAGAMVSMSANVELQSQMKGGLMGAL